MAISLWDADPDPALIGDAMGEFSASVAELLTSPPVQEHYEIAVELPGADPA